MNTSACTTAEDVACGSFDKVEAAERSSPSPNRVHRPGAPTWFKAMWHGTIWNDVNKQACGLTKSRGPQDAGCRQGTRDDLTLSHRAKPDVDLNSGALIMRTNGRVQKEPQTQTASDWFQDALME